MDHHQPRLFRDQSTGEEIANSISHGIGLLAALAITPLLVVAAWPAGATAIVSATIFGFSMIILYTASTLYHAFPTAHTAE